jgi:murein DD-endopeptidase MepM/ murein hydrolase activator NlpD
MRYKEFKEAAEDDSWNSFYLKAFKNAPNSSKPTDAPKSTDTPKSNAAPKATDAPNPPNASTTDKSRLIDIIRAYKNAPIQGDMTSKFGKTRGGGPHSGVDFRATSGTPLPAPVTGQVIRAEIANNNCGGTIIISDGEMIHTYCHCSKIDVKAGQYVKKGDIVGLSGGGPKDIGRGNSTGPHLHWEKKSVKTGKLLDPMKPDNDQI